MDLVPRVPGWPHSETHHLLFLKTGAWGHSRGMLLHSIYVAKRSPFHIISTPCIITKSTPFCSNVLHFLFQRMPCPSSSSCNFLFCNKLHWQDGFKKVWLFVLWDKLKPGWKLVNKGKQYTADCLVQQKDSTDFQKGHFFLSFLMIRGRKSQKWVFSHTIRIWELFFFHLPLRPGFAGCVPQEVDSEMLTWVQS